jgi:hypothetical protein
MKVLSNFDLDDIFANNSSYLGTFSKDTLKNVKLPKNKTTSAVINLQDTKDGQGTHWVAMFNNPNNRHIYYFDSYGVIPPTDVIKWLKSTEKRILYNTSEIQNINSVACGWYCIAFIKHCLANNDYLTFVNLFNQDGDPHFKNDLILKRLLKAYSPTL